MSGRWEKPRRSSAEGREVTAIMKRSGLAFPYRERAACDVSQKRGHYAATTARSGVGLPSAFRFGRVLGQVNGAFVDASSPTQSG